MNKNTKQKKLRRNNGYNKKKPKPLLLELREKIEIVFTESDGTLTNTGAVTDMPGREQWDMDYDDD